MIKVSSSNIDKIGYDIASKTLVIDFLSGGRYSYKNVPKMIFDNMLKSQSKGKYFYKNIREKYNFSKLY